jgi:hypothetical protein
LGLWRAQFLLIPRHSRNRQFGRQLEPSPTRPASSPHAQAFRELAFGTAYSASRPSAAAA